MNKKLLPLWIATASMALSAAENSFVGATGGDWFTPENWSLSSVPTIEDDVIIDNLSVNASGAITAGSITINGENGALTIGDNASRPMVNAQIAENLTISQASKLYVYAGEMADLSPFGEGEEAASAALYDSANTISVGGDLNVLGTIYPDYAPISGTPVIFDVGGDFTLSESGLVNGKRRGWSWAKTSFETAPDGARRRKYEGTHSPNGWTLAFGAGHNYGTGAGYGGDGMNKTTYYEKQFGYSYGLEYAPFLSGSPSGFYQDEGSNSSQLKCRGSSSFVIHAEGVAQIDGIVDVAGYSTDHGKASGGGIWIAASDITFGENSLLNAKGQDTPTHDSYGDSAGGRIALTYGATKAEITSMAQGTLPSTFRVFSTEDASHIDISRGSNDAEDGTFRTIRRNDAAGIVEVVGSPANAITQNIEYKEQVTINGSQVTYSITDYGYDPLDSENIRYTCVGYVLSNTSGEVASGDNTSCSFTFDASLAPYTLTWLWGEKETRASVFVYGDGQVTIDGISHSEDFTIWHSAATTFEISATPSAGSIFERFASSSFSGGVKYDSTISVDSASPLSVSASFISGTVKRVWVGANNASFWDNNNWSPAGLPSQLDNLYITNATITLDNTYPLSVKNLTISGGTFNISATSATVTEDNTPLYYTNLWKYATPVTVQDKFIVDGNATINVYCDPVSGAAVKFNIGDFFLGEDAKIRADSTVYNASGYRIAGWHWQESEGDPQATQTAGTYQTKAPGVGTSFNKGAGHGGKGGDNSTSTIYGNPYAPFLPGSPNGLYQNRISNGIPGGGVVWINALGDCTINGKITVDAGKNMYGSGSGGSIWIAAQTFFASPTASLSAKGGSISGNYGSMGAGGRISIALGLTQEELTALAKGETPQHLVYNDDITIINTNVDGGIRDTVNIIYGNPGTATTVFGENNPGLVLVSSSGAMAKGISPSYGLYSFEKGLSATFTAPETGIDPLDETIAYPCIGYTITDENGTTEPISNLSVQIIPSALPKTLTWLWGAPLFRLNAISGENGHLSSAAQPETEEITLWSTGIFETITAIPDSGYEFLYWEGNIPYNRAFDNPLTVNTTKPVKIKAVFRSFEEPTVRTFKGGTALWNDPMAWTPENIPGKDDTAIISSGTCMASNAISCANLTLSSNAKLLIGTLGDTNPFLKVSGNLQLSDTSVLRLGYASFTTSASEFPGADSYKRYESGHARAEIGGSVIMNGNSKFHIAGAPIEGNFTFASGSSIVNIGNALTLNDTSTLYLSSDVTTGGSVKITVPTFVLGEEASVNADKAGTMWRDSTTPPSMPGYGYSYQKGAAHGGYGTDTIDAKYAPYGFALAPVQPGSANGNYNNSNMKPGGGLIRIHSKFVTLNGTLTALPAKETYSGPSGGGIWITGQVFSFGDNAKLLARGDKTNYGYSYGSGGRIAIGKNLTEAQLSSLAETGEATGIKAKNTFDAATFKTLFNTPNLTIDVSSPGPPIQQGTFNYIDATKRQAILIMK